MWRYCAENFVSVEPLFPFSKVFHNGKRPLLLLALYSCSVGIMLAFPWGFLGVMLALYEHFPKSTYSLLTLSKKTDIKTNCQRDHSSVGRATGS